MARQKREATSWAADAAAAVAERVQRLEAATATRAAERQALGTLVAQSGRQFCDRLYVEVGAAIAAFNERLSLPRPVAVHVGEPRSGALTVNGRASGFVTLLPDLGPEGESGAKRADASLAVTVCGDTQSTRHFWFRREGAELVLDVDGILCGPETAARHLVGPWLTNFAINND